MWKKKEKNHKIDPVFENDSVESLKERVQELEGKAFIEVINNWSNYEY